MLISQQTNLFLRDARRMRKRGKDLIKLDCIIQLLLAQKPLPPRHRDHQLTGNWRGRRECHIEPDWLLIYQISATHLILERTGSHADLFE